MLDLIIDLINIFLVLFTLVYPNSDYAKYIDYVSFTLIIISFMYRVIIILIDNHDTLKYDLQLKLFENKIDILRSEKKVLEFENIDYISQLKEIYID